MSKLLIVNNSVALLEGMKNVLEYAGYSVKTLLRADDVYNTIHSFQPDLLILDTFLVAEDGRDICKELKKRTETKDLCILMFAFSPKHLRDYKNCFDDFIEKPFDLKVLMEKIKSLLQLATTRKSKFQFRLSTNK